MRGNAGSSKPPHTVTIGLFEVTRIELRGHYVSACHRRQREHTRGLETQSRTEKDYGKRNWMVTVRCIGTGLPSSDAGWYFHCFKASVAACCSNVGPETTFIVVTRPLASISASTVTLPETCWFLARVG